MNINGNLWSVKKNRNLPCPLMEQPTVGSLFFMRACVMATDARAVSVNSSVISLFKFDFDDPACLRMKSQLYSNEGNIT